MDPMKDAHSPQENPYGSSDRSAPGHDAPDHDAPRDGAWGYDTPSGDARRHDHPGPTPTAAHGAATPPPPFPAAQTPAAGTSPAPATAPPAAPRRGPGWGGVGALVVLGMMLSSGATLGGVVVYDQFLDPDPEVSTQPGTGSTSAAQPAAAITGEAPNWAAVADQVSPSTVAIKVATSAGTAQGTGVILDDNGAILTNNHVVEGAQEIQVSTSDGLSYPASVVGTDPTTDLAVIRMESPPEGLQPATFADSSTVEVGQPVMALGTPLGLENTVTTGIISAVDRPVTASGEQGDGAEATYTSALQTDAAINPGNSGGPLVDAAGQVIGINTAIASIPNASGQAGSIGLGFAIPASTATMIAEQLQEDGTAEHAFVGVTSTNGTASDGAATYSGAEVISIEPDSPAADSSLKKGDLIIGVDDTPVGGAAALTGVVRGLEIGSTHQFEVVRDGALQSVEITLGVRSS
ncbi:serine protease [Brachybacterium vulturis]|uniref:Serine protease n=1 Tax=Brachybacterium vulturis TaxID=2017484 RepID=A0A291GLL6_9MICO|nr:trypsin-like peptidase domain-containing protein [Brachybacterium vulturis]ATG51249.1 serine protease [Brachybacterium vulturis]